MERFTSCRPLLPHRCRNYKLTLRSLSIYFWPSFCGNGCNKISVRSSHSPLISLFILSPKICPPTFYLCFPPSHSLISASLVFLPFCYKIFFLRSFFPSLPLFLPFPCLFFHYSPLSSSILSSHSSPPPFLLFFHFYSFLLLLLLSPSTSSISSPSLPLTLHPSFTALHSPTLSLPPSLPSSLPPYLLPLSLSLLPPSPTLVFSLLLPPASRH